jgi:hypothetical protein
VASATTHGAVIVIGLADIQRDLKRSGPLVAKAMRRGLKESAEPVSRTAEQLSLEKIRRMPKSPQWAETRIGVIQSGVYIVPKQRGVRPGNPFDPRRRGWNIGPPNLITLMMGRSFEPALETNLPLIEARVSTLIGDVI